MNQQRFHGSGVNLPPLAKAQIKQRLFAILIACGGLLLCGCADRRAFLIADSWFSAPPASFPVDGPSLEANRVDTVRESHEFEAEELLAQQACLEITPQKAESLIGLPLRPHPGTRPYLLRSVYLIQKTGIIEIFLLRHNDLLVTNQCLGSRTTRMKRQALVVQLDEPPRQVFVVCRMTEQEPTAENSSP